MEHLSQINNSHYDYVNLDRLLAVLLSVDSKQGPGRQEISGHCEISLRNEKISLLTTKRTCNNTILLKTIFYTVSGNRLECNSAVTRALIGGVHSVYLCTGRLISFETNSNNN